MKYHLVFFTILTSFYACNPPPERKSGTMTLTWKRDSCYLLTDSSGHAIEAYRNLEIIDNTLDDTAAIGYGVIHPGFKGKVTYLRIKDGTLYPDTPVDQMPKTKTICVNQYQKRAVNGNVTIKYYY